MGYTLSIKTAVALCLSAIIGDTLFVVTGVPIAQAGSNSLLAFFVVGLLSLVIAMQLGELSSIMPNEKGAVYSFVKRAYGTELGFITGVLLFISYCAVISAITFSFGGYFLSLLGINSIILQIGVSSALIIAVSLLNMKGVRETSSFSVTLAGITIIAAIIFFAFAAYHGISNGVFLSNLANNASQNGLGALGEAVTTIVFAYAGFQTITTFTSSIKGQGKGLAKVLLYSILISIVAYLMVAIGLIMLVPSYKSIISPEPLLYALNSAGAPEYIVLMVGIGTLVAIAAAAIAILYTASRILYQIGMDGLLPRITRRFDASRDIAVNGIWISAIISIIMLFSGDLYQMVSIGNFGIIFSWMMACISVISLRRRGAKGSFRAPLYPYLPIIGMASCVIFLLGLPRASLAIGVVLVQILLVTYYGLIELRYKDVPKIRIFD
ncbi:MAG: APC family permease [Candidatus Marsarchaeota archaeon]|nr:APC family permease [Candidatus Marsarchaeota archaeon]MCL5413346.1 APC family permease [Candidatus Marsarchaeota archaeon]